jgi:predicted N-acetyltransferase YhbS
MVTKTTAMALIDLTHSSCRYRGRYSARFFIKGAECIVNRNYFLCGNKLLLIRQERPLDYAKVYQLVKMSFATSLQDDGTVPDYLEGLCKKDTFIPELSLVTEDVDEKIIGQIVLYKTVITTPCGELVELLLSPICVHPDYFRRGIARAMIKKALDIAKRMGFRAVFLCGNPEIYGKMGFLPTYHYNIFHKNDETKTAKWSMVYELYFGALNGISGTLTTV